MTRPLFLTLLLACTSCHFHRLEVQTQYLGSESLASFHVATPDPRLEKPPIGQRLLVQWWLEKECFQHSSTDLVLRVRFRNHQESETRIAIAKPRGYYLYKVDGPLFCKTQGILTYVAEIRVRRNEEKQEGAECEEVIARFQHPLWKTLIECVSAH